MVESSRCEWGKTPYMGGEGSRSTAGGCNGSKNIFTVTYGHAIIYFDRYAITILVPFVPTKEVVLPRYKLAAN